MLEGANYIYNYYNSDNRAQTLAARLVLQLIVGWRDQNNTNHIELPHFFSFPVTNLFLNSIDLQSHTIVCFIKVTMV